MKRIALFITILSFLSTQGYAQFTDLTKTNCHGVEKKTSEIIESGKVLLLNFPGTDCLGCNGYMPKVDTFATNNKEKIAVWSGVARMFTDASCKEIDSFANIYGLKDIFVYQDVNRSLIKQFGVEFVVVDKQKKLVYQGNSYLVAFEKALTASLAVSVNEISNPNFNFKIVNKELYFQGANYNNPITLNCYDINGKLVQTITKPFSLKKLEPSKLYLIQAIVGKEVISSKKVILQD